jgi:cation diffusion facilitator CzcD-associated flavoprotein CzcO
VNDHDIARPRFDAESVRAKYLVERDRRLVEGRAAIRDLTGDDEFARYRDDRFTAFIEREPVVEDVDAAIIGAGIAGICAGVELRRAGLARIRMIDEAGGVGGTWYWNQYPGVMCDVESYIYMPMLEDLEYVPTKKYASGEEIRSQLVALARKYRLEDGALLQTRSHSTEWDDEIGRWVIHTDRRDVIRARYLVMATGILNLMKLPAIPGMTDFTGTSFHTSRWNYDVTGGSPQGGLDKLQGKTVGLIGTGASGIQVLPHLTRSSERVLVFQRTPSAVGVRGNRTTEPEFASALQPGWQRARMDNFQAIMLGIPVDEDVVDDGWTRHFAATRRLPRDPAWTVTEYLQRVEAFDFQVMEEHRDRIVEVVEDPATAEILKPYYRYLCRRPCFHDEYLSAFNSPNVTLIDCPAGIERVTATGLVANGETFAVDCIVYATGFEAESTPLPRRVGQQVVGRDGMTLAQKWSDGAASLWGMTSRGFPNLFVMPAPGQQAVVTVSYTQLAMEGAEHVGDTVRRLEARGVRSFDVSADAEAAWCQGIIDAFVDGSRVMAACTPSRINNEGDPAGFRPRDGNFRGGFGDFFGYRQLLADWRATGEFEGLELDE